jgi:thiol-disulfide isomerase/thioredoxin
MRNLLILFALTFVIGQAGAGTPRAGIYRGVLLLNAAARAELPFNLEVLRVKKKTVIVIHNADERIEVREIKFRGDSMIFRMPVFDTEFRTRLTDSGFEGVWINHYRTNERIIPFTATFGESRRFNREGSHVPNVEGKWEATFSPGSANSSPAVALLHHIEQTPNLSGTFLTETGDYRYLEGIVHRDSLWLSAFDGSHAFLFTAGVRNDSLVNGIFYSGSHWQEPWLARKNNSASLRDPDKITSLSDTSAVLNFAYSNIKGRKVSLSDKKYRNRPVIVQLMGSWCPNCMDESRYLSGLHRQFNAQGLEVIALAFEKTADEKVIRRRLSKLKNELGIDYEILVTRAVGKDEASRSIPLLSQVSAFPTTLFLNRGHRVVRVHTGFSGPATGRPYNEFRAETETLVKKLLQ